MKGENHLPACQAYQDPKCCICALVRSHPEVEWKPIFCACVCHDKKWVKGIEHETMCCKNMVGWMQGNGSTSDGFHTFDELYEHRIVLFMALCRYFIQGKATYDKRNIWISKLHHDGSKYKGWFIMGIAKEKGNQITYHLPEKYWDEAKKYSEVLKRAPEWDEHSPNEVVARIKIL